MHARSKLLRRIECERAEVGLVPSHDRDWLKLWQDAHVVGGYRLHDYWHRKCRIGRQVQSLTHAREAEIEFDDPGHKSEGTLKGMIAIVEREAA